MASGAILAERVGRRGGQVPRGSVDGHVVHVVVPPAAEPWVAPGLEARREIEEAGEVVEVRVARHLEAGRGRAPLEQLLEQPDERAAPEIPWIHHAQAELAALRGRREE